MLKKWICKEVFCTSIFFIKMELFFFCISIFFTTRYNAKKNGYRAISIFFKESKNFSRLKKKWMQRYIHFFATEKMDIHFFCCFYEKEEKQQFCCKKNGYPFFLLKKNGYPFFLQQKKWISIFLKRMLFFEHPLDFGGGRAFIKFACY